MCDGDCNNCPDICLEEYEQVLEEIQVEVLEEIE